MTVENPEPALSLAIPPRMEELEGAIMALEEFWQLQRLDQKTQADLNIAVEEILTNVIRHAGTSQPISLQVDVQDGRARICIEDDGRAFDPLQHPLPDPNAPLEQRRAGGLGILMVRRMMDEVTYVRRQDRNRLTLVRVLQRT